MLRTAGARRVAPALPADLPLAERRRAAASGRPRAMLMNCSGKHAGMLLTCLAAGWPLEDYLRAGAPAAGARSRDAVEDLAGEPVGRDRRRRLRRAGVRAVADRPGPGVPARWCRAEPGTPERAVADAMRAHPELVSGTGREAHDTVLMRAVPGLLAKGGAEGVQAVAVPGVGAVAIKIDDGAQRARDARPLVGAAPARRGRC